MNRSLLIVIVIIPIFLTLAYFGFRAETNVDTQVDIDDQQVQFKSRERILIAVSIAPLADFVENVGGNRVDIIVMVPPSADPHTYELTPRQMTEVAKADMYVEVGSGLEFEEIWMNRIMENNKGMPIVDSSTGTWQIDRDPHIWTSPKNAKVMVENIYSALIAIDTENLTYYEANKDNYLEQLDELDLEVRESLEGVTNRNFLVYHPNWEYFSRDYGLNQMAVEDEGKEPSPERLASLIEQAKDNDIKVIFATSHRESRANVIAREIGGVVVLVDPFSQDYIETIAWIGAFLV